MHNKKPNKKRWILSVYVNYNCQMLTVLLRIGQHINKLEGLSEEFPLLYHLKLFLSVNVNQYEDSELV